MENKFKIILSYIQDLSVEIPNPESLITIRNTTPEYRMSVDISTKLQKKMRSSNYFNLYNQTRNKDIFK